MDGAYMFTPVCLLQHTSSTDLKIIWTERAQPDNEVIEKDTVALQISVDD